MFGQLFVKECRQTAKSLIYWLIVLVMIFDFASQLGDMDIEKKPEEGQEDYGNKLSDDKNVIMEKTLGLLAEEYNRQNYTTYPIGFYKSVTVDEEEDRRIGEIIAETTGLSERTDVEKAIKDWYGARQEDTEGTGPVMTEQLALEPVEGLRYERFEQLMKEADDILGGGSSYAVPGLEGNAVVPKTYEDAVVEYENLVEKDHLTGGYARLFSDYMVIFLGILPVFLAVTRGLRDRRAGMRDLIYARKGSSASIIVSRYLAMLVMIVLPVLILSFIPLSRCLAYASAAGISADIFAFVKYIFGWLMPTVMIAAAVGMFFTEVTDTALAVLVQGAWWFVSVFMGIDSLRGGLYGWSLIPRHNTELNFAGYYENFAQLVCNRILYASAAVILVVLTVIVYHQKRKGRYRLAWKGIGRLKRQI